MIKNIQKTSVNFLNASRLLVGFTAKFWVKRWKESVLQCFVVLGLCVFASSALAQQVPITTDSRIRTLVYNPNEVYELKFYYGYQSFIEFSEDEEIEMISIGEAFAWRLTPAGKRLFVRPLEIAGHTNMTIISNKRTYHFDIRSGEYDGRADEELVYTVRFFYPQIGQPLPIPPRLATPNLAAVPVERKSVIRTPIPGSRVDAPLPGIVSRNPEGSDLNFDFNKVDFKYYDSIGYMLSLASKNSKLDYKKNFSIKIKVWDKLINFSRIVDLLIFNKVGKSLIVKCIK